jgi:sugar phosphate isomerase/epimerase
MFGNNWRQALDFSRRDVLKQLSLGPSVAGFLAESQTLKQGPELPFPTAPRDRLAVTSWPFRAMMNSPMNHNRNRSVPGMDMKEFPAFVVEKFGVYNINPLSNHFSSLDAAYLEAFRAAVQRARSHVVDLGLSGGMFYDADASKRASAVAEGRKGIDVARAVGSPSVRQHVSGRPGQNADVMLAAESLGELAGYGAKQNIVVNLENDNPVAEDPFFLVAVIKKVNSPFLRALPDFGNSLIGHDAAFNERAMKAMLPYAWNMCHVKDTVESDSGKPLTVDLKSMFELAQASSYRGFFSMELDIASGDPVPGTKRLIQESLQYLG